MSQLAAVLRLEWKKSLFSKRGWWIYLLAFGPVFVTAAHSLSQAGSTHPSCTISEDNRIYAGVFQLFYLRLGIFFGCVGIFSNLFRGEVLEKTLHYYLLTPMRREVLVAGKYLAGLIAAVVCFTGSAVLAFLVVSMHFGQQYWDFILRGPGAGQLAVYGLITVLACAGYGAVFLMMGLLFSNPMIPAAAVMVWEAMNPFLPALLKTFSVIFYLKSLTPVDVPLRGPLMLLAVDADPVSAWLAVPGLLAVSALVLFYAAVRARQMEISYNE